MVRVTDIISPIQVTTITMKRVAASVIGNNLKNSVMSSVSKEFETQDHTRLFATKISLENHTKIQFTHNEIRLLIKD
jgi:hypothetical protein